MALHVSKQISIKLGGDLLVKSEERLGTSFSLILKDFHTNLNTSNQDILSSRLYEEIKEEAISPNGMYIEEYKKPFIKACNCPQFLVVDDDVINISILRNYLKSINECNDEALNG